MVLSLGWEKLQPERLLPPGSFPIVDERSRELDVVCLQDEAHVGFMSMVDSIMDSARAHLERGPDDPAIREQRRRMLRQDDVRETVIYPKNVPTARADLRLENVLRHDPTNRLACDLLVALYLSRGQSALVVAQIPRLKSSGHQRLPVLVEQAVLAEMARTCEPVPLEGFILSDQQQALFAQFNGILTSCGSDRRLAQTRLENADLGPTYWYRLWFGLGRAW